MRQSKQHTHDPEHDKLHAEHFGRVQQIAFFHWGARRDNAASKLHGHDAYVSAPFVQIKNAGDRDGISVPATREHAQQFPAEWQMFQERGHAVTSLRALPTLDEGTFRTLTELGFRCVEEVAAAPVVERVETLAEEKPATVEDITREFAADQGERERPKLIPAYLARWQKIAQGYMQLRQFAISGEKPRIKLEVVQ